MELIQTPNNLQALVAESGLDKSKAQVLIDNFSDYQALAAEWEAKIEALEITGPDDKEGIKLAKEARVFLKNKRTSLEAKRKELKDSSLKEGKAIDSIAKALTALIEPLEEKAEKKEKYWELKAAEEKLERHRVRTQEAYQYAEFIPMNMDFGGLSDEDFNKLMAGAKLQLDAKAEAERKEQERIENERQSQLKKQAIADGRLKTIQPYYQFFNKSISLSDLDEQEFDALLVGLKKDLSDYQDAQEKLRKENEELKKQAEINAKKQAEERRIAEEKLRKEREESEAKLLQEQAERARIQNELLVKEQAETKAKEAEQSRIEAELAKGDTDKLASLIVDLNYLKTKYQFKSKKHQKILVGVIDMLDKMITWITSASSK